MGSRKVSIIISFLRNAEYSPGRVRSSSQSVFQIILILTLRCGLWRSIWSWRHSGSYLQTASAVDSGLNWLHYVRTRRSSFTTYGSSSLLCMLYAVTFDAWATIMNFDRLIGLTLRFPCTRSAVFPIEFQLDITQSWNNIGVGVC